MAITIQEEGYYLSITDSGVVRVTIPKRLVSLQIKGTELHITHQGEYAYECEFSDVTTPATANNEALRSAVTNMITTL